MSTSNEVDIFNLEYFVIYIFFSILYTFRSLALRETNSAGIARTMSPIAGVIIAVSGITGLTPIALIRRTIPVMIIAVIVSVTSSLIFL